MEGVAIRSLRVPTEGGVERRRMRVGLEGSLSAIPD